MRKDKAVAFALRKESKSYRHIQKKLGVSRSTLCDWFRNEEWSTHIKKSNSNKNIILSTERLRLLQKGRSKMFFDKYSNVELEAEREFSVYKKRAFIYGRFNDLCWRG